MMVIDSKCKVLTCCKDLHTNIALCMFTFKRLIIPSSASMETDRV